jgi:REP element-mobilizing transposase RayT
MPRANRHFLPGHVWHIIHRCHQKKFLLKFARDRRRYLHWLFEAKKRFGLSVLNYMITSNHVHLLIKDTEPNVIADSMQLIAGRTAQEYNQRKGRQGAFWEDRYHATAIEADEHLHCCRQWVEQTLESGRTVRDDRWSEAVAVGSLVFVQSVKGELGGRAMHRGVEQKDGAYALRERNEAYNGDFSGKSELLRLENTVFWNENPAATET